MNEVTCQYCGKQAELVGGHVIYPHRDDLRSKQFYLCIACDAYVGCHRNTDRPLGQLANRETRLMRQMAHAAFDPIWNGTHISRNDAYGALTYSLAIPKDQCHIGMFDVEQCERVYKFVSAVRVLMTRYPKWHAQHKSLTRFVKSIGREKILWMMENDGTQTR